jgi:sugar lactone lactonase YvrE
MLPSIPGIPQWLSRCNPCQPFHSVTPGHLKARRSLHLLGLLVVLLAASKPLIGQLVQANATPLVFPATNVGSSSAPQNLMLQTTTTESITGFTVLLSQGDKQEYTVGAVTGCAVDGVTSNQAGTICTLSITFKPGYPGLRPVPLQAVTSAGNVNIALNGLGVAPLAAITPGTISTIAGELSAPNCNAYSGPALQGPICNPSAGAVDAVGNVYVAAFYSNTVDKIDTNGNITVIAGTGAGGLSGVGGPATSATFDRPSDVVIDPAGNIYFAAETAEQIFKIDATTKILTSIAGNGIEGYSGDNGPATMASFNRPEGLALDPQGNLYVEDQDNNLIRKINTAGIITTVAGNPATINQGLPTYGGDGGPATQAGLALCCQGVYASYDSIFVDPGGNLYIGDSGHHVVRKVTTDGIIHTIAGNNALGGGFSGDGGAATSAQLNWPMGVATDPAGDVYIADFSNNRIRKIDAATQIITTVIGNGLTGSPSSGLATQVNLNGPQKIALDGEGNLYVADTKNNLVRETNVSNPTLTFATPTAVGSTDTTDGPLAVVISDIGNAPLMVEPPSSGTNPSVSTSFSLFTGETGACPSVGSSSSAATLGQGSSCTLEVNFAPVTSGSITGSLVLTDNSLNTAAPYAMQTITLDGTATGNAGPQPVLTPATLNFGSITVQTTSAGQTVTLSNTGGVPQGISSFGFFGTNTSSFSQTNNCGVSLAAGASCTFSITCTPSATGVLTANLGVNFPSPEPQESVALSCTGTAAAAPQAALTPGVVNFSTISGTSSAPTTFTLTNAGNASLAITSVSISGTNASSFMIGANTCGSSVAASGTCTIAVSFAPASAGSYAASLSVTDAVGVQTSTLSGTATAPAAPMAALTPASASFGSVTSGTTSAAKTFTLTNSGNATLSISGITLAGANASDFAIGSSTCGEALAASGTCSIAITFTPSATGSFSATLSVADNAAGSPQTSALTGTGIVPPDFTVLATPAAQTVASGGVASYSVSVSSTNGSFTNPVTLTAMGLPGGTITFSRSSVTPGSSSAQATMTVQTTTQQARAHPHWPFAAPVFAAFLLLLPGRRWRSRKAFMNLACLIALISIATSTIGCGGGFALPAKTYTLTVTGTSGADTHSTTVTLTVQ